MITALKIEIGPTQNQNDVGGRWHLNYRNQLYGNAMLSRGRLDDMVEADLFEMLLDNFNESFKKIKLMAEEKSMMTSKPRPAMKYRSPGLG